MCEEVRLYKLITESDEDDISIVEEYRWEGDEFLVWIHYAFVHEFMNRLQDIFGNTMFDDGSFTATCLQDYMCIDLCDVLSGHVDIDDIFEKG